MVQYFSRKSFTNRGNQDPTFAMKDWDSASVSDRSASSGVSRRETVEQSGACAESDRNRAKRHFAAMRYRQLVLR